MIKRPTTRLVIEQQEFNITKLYESHLEILEPIVMVGYEERFKAHRQATNRPLAHKAYTPKLMSIILLNEEMNKSPFIKGIQ